MGIIMNKLPLKNIYLAVASSVAALTISTQALAGSFTTENAKIFAECLPSMNTLGAELMKDPKAGPVFEQTNQTPVVDGKLQVYSKPLMALKTAVPAAYNRIDKQAKSCGIESAVVFANLGDQIMAAYMAHKMPPGVAAQMAQLPPEMLAQMPPEAKQGLAMLRMAESVPEEDKAALTPEVLSLLDKALQEAAALGPDLSNAFGQ